MNNLFDNNEARTTSVMKPAPRKEGCEMTGIELKEDHSVIFSFVDATGATLNHRIFMPTRKEGATDEEFAKSIQLTLSSIQHITRAYISEEAFKAIKVQGGENLNKLKDTWLDYIKQVGSALSGKYKGVKCALKVVYRKSTKDNKSYASLPNVPEFISTENHPKEFTTNPAYDKYELTNSNAPDKEAAPQQQGGAATNSAPGQW